jgi:hypothetical protein
MSSQQFDDFEKTLAAMHPAGAPAELRQAVLTDTCRELRAARWDRRLMRTAVLLLIVGVGLNAVLAFPDAKPREAGRGQVARNPSRELLIDTAIVVAEATDAETGRQYARQLAALSGRVLTEQEIASIDAAAHNGRG